jgi:hypothetical protein
MATPHLRAQSLKRPKLKLFDGALAFLEPGGDFADRTLLDEALANDAALNGGKPVNQAVETGVVFAGLEVADSVFCPRGSVRRVLGHWVFARGAFVLVG